MVAGLQAELPRGSAASLVDASKGRERHLPIEDLGGAFDGSVAVLGHIRARNAALDSPTVAGPRGVPDDAGDQRRLPAAEEG